MRVSAKTCGLRICVQLDWEAAPHVFSDMLRMLSTVWRLLKDTSSVSRDDSLSRPVEARSAAAGRSCATHLGESG
jgi:hypothetical protein